MSNSGNRPPVTPSGFYKAAAVKGGKRKHKIHHRPKSRIKPAETKNEINVTPLVDVVLVLLIIFMVVTPMLHRGVELELPKTKSHDKKQDTGEQLVVSVREDGIYIESDRVTEEELTDRVKKELTGKSRPLHVRADVKLKYKKVRDVLEKIHNAGAQDVGMATDDQTKK